METIPLRIKKMMTLLIMKTELEMLKIIREPNS
jgi:hypothetical protein